MPIYKVDVKEVHIQPYFVNTDSPKKAIEAVACNMGNENICSIDESGFEYSYTLEVDTFDVHYGTDEEQKKYNYLTLWE